MTVEGLRSASVNDIVIAFEERGSGPPAVFIHGLGEGLGTWRYIVSHLETWTSFAYDQRGHGGSSLGAADGTLEQLADDLIGFLDTVSGPAACVGSSLGGTVVLIAAAHRPDLITKACVLATSSVVGRRAVAYYRDRIRLVEAGDSAALAEAVETDTIAAIAHPERANIPRLVADRLSAIGDGRGYRNAAVALQRLHTADLAPRLQQITVPVWVVGGELDEFCPRKAADIMVEAIPHAEYREIANAAHHLNADAPDAVLDVVQQFLSTVG